MGIHCKIHQDFHFGKLDIHIRHSIGSHCMPLHFCIISPARQGAIRIYPTAHTSTMSVIYHRTLLTVTKYHIFHRNESVDIKCIDSESIQRRSIYIICFRILFYNLLTNKVPSVTVKQCLIIGSTIYFNTFDSMAAAGFADRLDNAFVYIGKNTCSIFRIEYFHSGIIPHPPNTVYHYFRLF